MARDIVDLFPYVLISITWRAFSEDFIFYRDVG